MKLDIITNKEKDGLELHFSEKPGEKILSRLKEAGFFFSRSKNIWWAKHSELLENFSLVLKGAVENGKEDFLFPVEPGYEPTEENIDLKNFSFISVSLKGEGKNVVENYLVFEPRKNLAALIARNSLEKKFGEALKGIKIYPKEYLKKARVLFGEKKIIGLSESGGRLKNAEEEEKKWVPLREEEKKEDGLKGKEKKSEEIKEDNTMEEKDEKLSKKYRGIQDLEIYHRIYLKLKKLIPHLEEHLQKGTYSGKSKLSSGGMMDLNYDFQQKNADGSYRIALSHYFKQNGDMVADPDMGILIRPKEELAEALHYQDQFGYKEVYAFENGKELVNLREKKSQNHFLNQWLSNALNQGHEIIMDQEEEAEKEDFLQKENNAKENSGDADAKEQIVEDTDLNKIRTLVAEEKLKIVKAISWTADPKDKGLQKLVAYFVGKEVYPEEFLGVYFDGQGVVASNGQKLLFVKTDQKKYRGLYCMSHQCWKNIRIDKKDGEGLTQAEQEEARRFRTRKLKAFSHYEEILNVEFAMILPLDAKKVLQYLSALKKAELIEGPYYRCAFKAGDLIFGMSAQFLIDGIKTMLALGHTELEYGVIAYNKMTVIVPAGQMEKVKDREIDFILLMPQILDTEEGKLSGEYLYYDLEKQEAFISRVQKDSPEGVASDDANVEAEKKELKAGNAVIENIKNNETYIPNVLIPEGVEEPFSSQDFHVFDMPHILKNNFPNLLKVTEGNLAELSAVEMFQLIQFSHPKDYGIRLSRNSMLEEWEKRGRDIFIELGYPVDEEYPYVNIYNGYKSIDTLGEIIHEDMGGEKKWWNCPATYRPVADLEKGVEILEDKIEKKNKEKSLYLNETTGRAIGKYKEQVNEIDWTIRSFNEGLEIVKKYLEKKGNPYAETDPKKKKKIKSEISSTAKNQHELNIEIEDFILTRDIEEDGEYSEEEKHYISKYSGSGGLIKQGAEGKGILYEYYTPEEIVKKMWGLAYKYGYNGGAVLEPACGIGRFLKYLPGSAVLNSVAYEINPTAVSIVEILYPDLEIRQQLFESLFFAGNVHLKGPYSGKLFDLVIGNPPYGDFSGKYAGMGEKKYTGATEYDQYFILRCLEMLRPSGLLIFIIPSSFLENGNKFNGVKEKISLVAELLDAYRLPIRVFDTTDIGTDIIVLKKMG